MTLQRQFGTCSACGCNPCRCGSPVDNRPPFRRLLVEPCVCGGPDIVASSGSPFDVAAAVVRHQVEPVHIAYDIAQGSALSIAQMEARALDREMTGVGA